jgi:tetratricopeptide (TPR) repeat protein
VISVRLLATESGDALVALRESAHDSTRILAALDKLSRQLRERIGGTLHGVHATQPLEEVTTSSLEALRKYSLGVQATRRGEEQRAVALLEEATALDTGFAMAYRKVGIILGNVEMSRSRQVEALREAYAHRERLTDRERYLAVAGWAGNAAGDVEHAMEAYRSVLDLYPADATAANNLAMDYNGIGEPAKAEELARRAIGSDPTFPGSWMHLAHSKFLQGQTDSARRVVAASRPHLAPPFRDLLAADLATNAGEYDSATAHYEQMGQARSEDAGWRRVASTGLARVHAIRGRLRLAEREYDAATEAARAQHNDMQVLKVAIERAKLSLLRGDQADVIKTIDGLVPRDSLAALPPLDRQHLALAELYALAGKPDRSRALVTQYEHDVPAELRSTDEAEHHAALGAIALAERRPDDAAADFSRMRVYGCGACNLPLLARAYDAGDHPDSALATYERYVTMASLNRNEADLISRGPALFRLGELYEATGDRAKAADYYGQFVVLWKHADPELQPRVVEAKRRLAALSEERSR